LLQSPDSHPGAQDYFIWQSAVPKERVCVQEQCECPKYQAGLPFTVLAVKLELGKKAFSFFGPENYNALPLTIKGNSLLYFRNKIKGIYF
jgi:hypothetical protein